MTHRASVRLLSALALTLACACGSTPPGGEGSSGSAGSTGSSGSSGTSGTGSTGQAPTFARPACTKDGWCWEEPLPQGNALASVWAAAADDVWAVGKRGIIAHRDASTWGALYFEGGQDEDFAAVHGSSASDLWIVGTRARSEPSIVHYDGSTLSRVDASELSSSLSRGEQASLQAVWSFGPKDVWVGGSHLWHFDGHWKLVPSAGATQFSQPTLHDLWASGPHDLWAAGGNEEGTATPWVAHYDGQSWTPLAFAPSAKGTVVRIRGSGPDDVWAVTSATDSDALYHWNGSEWSPVAGLSATDRYDGLAAPGPGSVYVLSSGRLLHNDGHTWSIASAAPDTSSHGRALAILPGGGLEAVGAGGFCASWKSGWTVEVKPSSVQSVLALGPNDVYAADYDGSALASTHLRVRHFDGASWSTAFVADHAGGFRKALLRATASNDLWLAALGDDANAPEIFSDAWHWDGSTWATLPDLTGYDLRLVDFAVTSPTQVWAVGSVGAYRLNGPSWLQTFGENVQAIWGAGASLWIAASDSVQEARSEGVWEPVAPLSASSGVVLWGTAEDDRWILDEGKPLHWTTGAPVPADLPNGEAAHFIFGSSATDTWIGTAYSVRHWEGSLWSTAQITGAHGQPSDLNQANVNAFPDDPTLLDGSSAGTELWLATGSGLMRHHTP